MTMFTMIKQISNRGEKMKKGNMCNTYSIYLYDSVGTYTHVHAHRVVNNMLHVLLLGKLRFLVDVSSEVTE